MPKLSSATQESLLALICFDDSSGKSIRALITPKVFDPFFRQIAEEADKYWEKYKKCPNDHTVDIIEALIEREPDSKQAYDTIRYSLFATKDSINREYVVGQVQVFARHQKAKATLTKSVQLLQQGTETALQEAESLMSAVGKNTIDLQSPGLLLNDPAQALRFLSKDPDQNTFPLGIPELDKYHLGPARKKYHLTVACTNTGKSISLDSRVWLPSSGYVPMRDLIKKKRFDVFGIECHTKLPSQCQAVDVFSSGSKRVCEITLKSGRCLNGFADSHPVLTWRGYVRADRLKIGDFVVGSASLPLTGKCTQQELIDSYTIGVFLGDGCLVAKDGPRLSAHKNERNIIDAVARSVGHPGRVREKGNGLDISYGKAVFQFFDRYGVERKRSIHKKVPRRIYQMGAEAVACCLAGLFDTDGSISVTQSGNSVLSFGTSSYDLSEDILTMLNVVGIYARRRRKRIRQDGKTFRSFDIALTDAESLRIFSERVGVYCTNKKKKNRIRIRYVGRERGQRFKRLPHQALLELIEDTKKATSWSVAGLSRAGGLSSSDAHALKRNGSRPSLPETVRKMAVYVENDHIAAMASGELTFDEIISIGWGAPEECWDMSTEESHQSFLAEHVFTHNSWMAVQQGKMALMHGYRVLHITLEMDEDEVAQRYVQSLFSVSKRVAKQLTRHFEKDESGRFLSIEERQLKRPTLQQDDIAKLLTAKLAQLKHKPSLYVKEFPSGSLTVRKLKAFMDYLESVHNFAPDLAIVDYPDLFEIDVKHKRESIDRIAVDLRGIAGERNIAVSGFSQVNETRQGNLIKTGRAFESRGKEHTADIVLSLNQTEAEYELGLLRVFVAKSRTDVKHLKVLISQNLALGQFCLDSCLMSEGSYWQAVNENGDNGE